MACSTVVHFRSSDAEYMYGDGGVGCTGEYTRSLDRVSMTSRLKQEQCYGKEAGRRSTLWDAAWYLLSTH